MIFKTKLIVLIKKSQFLLNFLAYIYSFHSRINIKGRFKNKVSFNGAFLKNTNIKFKGKGNILLIAPENRLTNCKVNVQGNNCRITIEGHCILSNLELWIEDDRGIIQIGYRTTIEGGHIAATEGHSITIGKDCMFSHAIVIRNGDSHSIFDKETNQRINSAQNVQIGDHVWLGEGVKVLKGSIIEEGSIIGTGAIVSGWVEKASIYAGIPAKKRKENIIWTRERR